MSAYSKQPTAPFNPLYGCAIMMIAILVFGGIIAWAFYSLTTQDREIAKFAVEQPVKPTAQRPDEAGMADLKRRLSEFATQTAGKQPASIVLTTQELNALMDLAPDTGYGKFTDMIAFKSVRDGKVLVADVCFPLNKAKFWEGKRYAVGEATFTVEIVKDRGPDMKLASLIVPGKEVSAGFLEAFGGWHWLTPYQKLETLAPTLKAITKVSITSTGIELVSQP